MKAPVMALKFLLVVVAGAIPVSDSVTAGEKVLRAGAFAIDITPTKFPVSSNGSMRERKATGANDPLHARCLVLDNGRASVAIVVCDSCMIPRDIFDAAKKSASKATGIPVENMMMSATHTHTAVTVTGVFQSQPETAYRKFLARQIAAGVRKAHARLEPARVGWAVGSDPTQVFNRRWFMKPGYKFVDPFGRGGDRVRMNPGRANPLLSKPAGPTDPQVCLLSVQSRTGRPIAVLANYSLHYVGGVPGGMLSADYFGEFARRFASRIGATAKKGRPAFVGMMSNGTSGDINNINFRIRGRRRKPFEQIRVVALSVTDAAFKAYKTIEYRDWVPLKMRESEIELGVRKPPRDDVAKARKLLAAAGPGPYRKREDIYARETLLMAKYPRTVRVKLQAIRIGELGIVSSPCETFVQTGLAIKKHSPLKPTFTIELANGYNGYLPTPEQHKLGGYETWRARSSYLAVDAEPKIRRTLLKLLEEVAK
ncbi:MAG: hypothetical protein ACE5KM_04650 [Planctomycetaceae bacterium]